MVPDRTLLLLSKKIATTWPDVGRCLGLEDDEIKGIQHIEGDTYTGAFKMLFAWRTSAPYTEEAITILCTALKKAGHQELTAMIKGK